MDIGNQVAGLKVVCPNCKRKDFITTEKYNPNVTPNGSMVKCLLTYHIDWLCSSTTGVAEMTCPECLAQLAPSGKLIVIPTTINEIKDPLPVPQDSEPPKFVCESCGKIVSTKLALAGHMRSHQSKKVK
jgi:hypothetical protein